MSQVMENLPACSSSQVSDWERVMLRDNTYGTPPPCRPDAAQKIAAISYIRSEITREIPDQVNLMENAHFPHNRFNVARTVRSFTYLLFLIPAFFIALGKQALIELPVFFKRRFLKRGQCQRIIGRVVAVGFNLMDDGGIHRAFIFFTQTGI